MTRQRPRRYRFRNCDAAWRVFRMSELNEEPIEVVMPHWGVVFAESRHQPGFRMSRRSDPFYKFLLVRQGEVKLEVGDREPCSLEADTIAYVPAGVGHTLEDATPASLLILCLTPSFPERMETCKPVWTELERGMQRPLVPSGLLSQKIETAWRKGIREQGFRASFSPLSVQLQALEILVSLVRALHYPRKTDPRLRIQQLLQLMDEEYSEHWDIERAAKLVNLSRRRFSDCFREIAGRPFVERLTRIRLEKACEFMRSGEFSIAGAGFSAGFNDLSHFYRVFKKYMQQTPGEWLKGQDRA